MSRMLTLNHAGWSAAQSLVRQGRRREALTQVERLLDRSDLSGRVRAEAHRLAAELLIDREQYAKARHYLHEAASLEPDVARTLELTGQAYENDPHGDDRKAAICYRKASALEPENELYRARFGRAAIRCGKVKTGVQSLHAAAESAPGAVPVLLVVVEGLLEAGRVKSARRVLVKARFLCPGNRELARLWERVRFEAARVEQNTWKPQEARFATDGDVAFLPFVRVVRPGQRSASGGGVIRRDLASMPRPHFPRLRTLKADR